MKILLILPELHLGGTERQVLVLARELAALDHEVRILALRPPRRPFPFEHGVQVEQADVASASPRSFFVIRRCMRAFRPDVVHTFLFGFDLYANLAARLCRVPRILSSRRQLAAWRTWRHRLFQNLANLLVDAVIANSQAAADYTYRSERFVNRGAIHVIPNAYDPRGPAGESDAALPAKTGPCIVNIANFWPGKGQDMLLQAFAAVHRQQDNVALWFIGDGPEQDALKKETHALGLGAAVHFLGRRHDIDRILSNADLCVHASVSESSPNAVLEAMGAGVPVVAVACGGVAELLQGGALGRLVPVGDTVTLERAIRSALDRGEETEDRVAAARRAVHATHSPTGMAQRYLELYRPHPRTRVGIFTIGGADVPSTWFRIFQMIPALQAAGFNVELFGLPPTGGGRLSQILGLARQRCVRACQLRKVKRYDVVLVQKGLTPCRWRGLAQRLLAAGVPCVYDFDDAVHRALPVTLPRPLRLFQDMAEPVVLMRGACHVIAGNATLAEAAREFCDHVSVVPTVIDTNRFWYAPREPADPVVIGWSGSTSTNIYLNPLLPILHRLAETETFKLLLLSDSLRNIDPSALAALDAEFVPWSRQNEVDTLHRMDIGVMPLKNSPWTRGKCGAKALLYMALGIPPVCAPVGVNTEIVTDGVDGFLAGTDEAWAHKLSLLVGDPGLRYRLGRQARQTVIQRYSVASQAARFAGCVRNSLEEAKRHD